mmetsp:Transcript_34626/g.83784  ORF Transcript_34626/g.83784 Transcript_34626/m.83784 type:complete len:434 (+) Transcript_34626:94-1395(+)
MMLATTVLLLEASLGVGQRVGGRRCFFRRAATSDNLSVKGRILPLVHRVPFACPSYRRGVALIVSQSKKDEDEDEFFNFFEEDSIEDGSTSKDETEVGKIQSTDAAGEQKPSNINTIDSEGPPVILSQSDNPDESNPDWWEEAHRAGRYDNTEFVGTYSDIRNTIHMVLGVDVNDFHDKAQMKVLDVGCGASLISEEMYLDGFRDITGIDISKSVIETVRNRYQDPVKMKRKIEPLGPPKLTDPNANGMMNTDMAFEDQVDPTLPKELQDLPDHVFFSAEGTEGAAKFPPQEFMRNEIANSWKWGKSLEGFKPKFEVADVRAMQGKFNQNQFDIVIDKGTLESVAVGNQYRDVYLMLKSVSDVLKPGGLFLSISFGLPEQRTALLSGPLPNLRGLYGWSVYPQELVGKDGITFTMYICRKKKEVNTGRSLHQQ